jgi:RNA-directed DNA polymerase
MFAHGTSPESLLGWAGPCRTRHNQVDNVSFGWCPGPDANVEEPVDRLNRKIGGWANYYSARVSKRIFNKMDHLVYEKLKRWAECRHPTKTHGWVRRHYWHHVVQQNPEGYQRVQRWVFGQHDGPVLALHTNAVIRRHTKVEQDRSPFDGDVLYWATRLGRHPELPHGKAILLKRQCGRCAWCGRLFQTMDEIADVDHIQPLVHYGTDRLDNRQLLHGHCHDAKTAGDGSCQTRSPEVPMTRAKKKTERHTLPNS